MTRIRKISDAANIGLHAMVYMGREADRLFRAKEIADALGVSPAHLAKVLLLLSRGNLLNSVRGPRGGFSLARAPREINLLQVYEAVDGPIRSRACLLNGPACGDGSCILGGFIPEVDIKIRDHLKKKSLSDFGGAAKKKGGKS